MALVLRVRLPLGVSEKRWADRPVLREDDSRSLRQHGLEPLLPPLLAGLQVQVQPATVLCRRGRLAQPLQLLPQRTPRLAQLSDRLCDQPPLQARVVPRLKT